MCISSIISDAKKTGQSNFAKHTKLEALFKNMPQWGSGLKSIWPILKGRATYSYADFILLCINIYTKQVLFLHWIWLSRDAAMLFCSLIIKSSKWLMMYLTFLPYILALFLTFLIVTQIKWQKQMAAPTVMFSWHTNVNCHQTGWETESKLLCAYF